MFSSHHRSFFWAILSFETCWQSSVQSSVPVRLSHRSDHVMLAPLTYDFVATLRVHVVSFSRSTSNMPSFLSIHANTSPARHLCQELFFHIPLLSIPTIPEFLAWTAWSLDELRTRLRHDFALRLLNALHSCRLPRRRADVPTACASVDNELISAPVCVFVVFSSKYGVELLAEEFIRAATFVNRHVIPWMSVFKNWSLYIGVGHVITRQPHIAYFLRRICTHFDRSPQIDSRVLQGLFKTFAYTDKAVQFVNKIHILQHFVTYSCTIWCTICAQVLGQHVRYLVQMCTTCQVPSNLCNNPSKVLHIVCGCLYMFSK